MLDVGALCLWGECSLSDLKELSESSLIALWLLSGCSLIVLCSLGLPRVCPDCVLAPICKLPWPGLRWSPKSILGTSRTFYVNCTTDVIFFIYAKQDKIQGILGEHPYLESKVSGCSVLSLTHRYILQIYHSLKRFGGKYFKYKNVSNDKGEPLCHKYLHS